MQYVPLQICRQPFFHSGWCQNWRSQVLVEVHFINTFTQILLLKSNHIHFEEETFTVFLVDSISESKIWVWWYQNTYWLGWFWSPALGTSALAARSLTRNHAGSQSTYTQPIYSSYMKIVMMCLKSQNRPGSWDPIFTWPCPLPSALRLVWCDPGLWW